ncbi:MAG: DUF2188 domain-containing protein [Bacilli bacterium]|nr:DUF2188 domain-containing protein [Bacilli bacterium]
MAKEVKKDNKAAKPAAKPAKKEEKKPAAKAAAKPAAKPAKKEEKKPAAKAPAKAAPAKKEEKPAAKEISNKTYHISKRKEDGKWQVKFASGQKAIKLFDTQAEAIDYAKKLADNQEGSISIHKVDGKIRKQNYGK